MLDPAKLAKANETRVLTRLEENGRQSAVAAAMRTSESTISRMKGDHLTQICELLAHLNLKVVPQECSMISPDTLRVLIHGHKCWADSIKSIEDLTDGL